MARQSTKLDARRSKTLTLRKSKPTTRHRASDEQVESGIPVLGGRSLALLAAVWSLLIGLPLAPVAYAHFTAPSAADRYQVYLDGYALGSTHPRDARTRDLCEAAAPTAPQRLHNAFVLGCTDSSAVDTPRKTRAGVDDWFSQD